MSREEDERIIAAALAHAAADDTRHHHDGHDGDGDDEADAGPSRAGLVAEAYSVLSSLDRLDAASSSSDAVAAAAAAAQHAQSLAAARKVIRALVSTVSLTESTDEQSERIASLEAELSEARAAAAAASAKAAAATAAAAVPSAAARAPLLDAPLPELPPPPPLPTSASTASSRASVALRGVAPDEGHFMDAARRAVASVRLTSVASLASPSRAASTAAGAGGAPPATQARKSNTSGASQQSADEPAADEDENAAAHLFAAIRALQESISLDAVAAAAAADAEQDEGSQAAGRGAPTGLDSDLLMGGGGGGGVLRIPLDDDGALGGGAAITAAGHSGHGVGAHAGAAAGGAASMGGASADAHAPSAAGGVSALYRELAEWKMRFNEATERSRLLENELSRAKLSMLRSGAPVLTQKAGMENEISSLRQQLADAEREMREERERAFVALQESSSLRREVEELRATMQDAQQSARKPSASVSAGGSAPRTPPSGATGRVPSVPPTGADADSLQSDVSSASRAQASDSAGGSAAGDAALAPASSAGGDGAGSAAGERSSGGGGLSELAMQLLRLKDQEIEQLKEASRTVRAEKDMLEKQVNILRHQVERDAQMHQLVLEETREEYTLQLAEVNNTVRDLEQKNSQLRADIFRQRDGFEKQLADAKLLALRKHMPTRNKEDELQKLVDQLQEAFSEEQSRRQRAEQQSEVAVGRLQGVIDERNAFEIKMKEAQVDARELRGKLRDNEERFRRELSELQDQFAMLDSARPSETAKDSKIRALQLQMLGLEADRAQLTEQLRLQREQKASMSQAAAEDQRSKWFAILERQKAAFVEDYKNQMRQREQYLENQVAQLRQQLDALQASGRSPAQGARAPAAGAAASAASPSPAAAGGASRAAAAAPTTPVTNNGSLWVRRTADDGLPEYEVNGATNEIVISFDD